MQRRKFLATSAATIPAIAFGPAFASPVSRTTKGFVVKASESRFKENTLLFGTNPNDIKISSKDTDGRLTVFEYTGKEKSGPPLHVHLMQDEIFFIVEGGYKFKVGEEFHHLKSGDTIFLPRMVPHCFVQTTDNGKMFFMFHPSGKMEDFFRAIGALKGQPTPEQGAKIFADHDMKIVGPPLDI